MSRHAMPYMHRRPADPNWGWQGDGAPSPMDDLCDCPDCGHLNAPNNLSLRSALFHFLCRNCGAQYSQPSETLLEERLEAAHDRSLCYD